MNDRKLRSPLLWSSTGFIALLVLSVLWPEPVVWLNDRTLRAALAVDHRSFLGREAPSWDVAFWGIAGLYLLALLHGRTEQLRASWTSLRDDMASVTRSLRQGSRLVGWLAPFALLVTSAMVVAATWFFLDAPLVDRADLLRAEPGLSLMRILNRLGGGMNPALLVLFFVLSGLAFGLRRWWRVGMAMALAGLTGGIAVQIIKVLVDRTRPELWLGPFRFIDSTSSSFPSGHTVGAFALGGVLLFGSRSRLLRIGVLLVSVGIGASRVVAFRHWPSDVVASGLIGLWLGWYFTVSLVLLPEAQEAGGERPPNLVS